MEEPLWVELQRFGHGSPATTALGGFPTFTPRLSDDKVAPFLAVRATVRMLLSPASYRRRNGAAGR
jgi:hypothetical protein